MEHMVGESIMCSRRITPLLDPPSQRTQSITSNYNNVPNIKIALPPLEHGALIFPLGGLGDAAGCSQSPNVAPMDRQLPKTP